MGLLKLPREFHPDFAVKRRQPSGSVQIDQSNEIAKGLVGAISSTFGRAVSEDVDGVYDTRFGQLGFGISGGTGSGSSWLLPDMPYISNFAQHSVFVYFGQTDFLASSGGDVYYCERPNGTQIFKLVNASNGGNDTVTFIIRNDASGGLINHANHVFPDLTKTLHSACLVTAGDTDRRLYCDGVEELITTDSGGSYSGSVTPEILDDPEDGDVDNLNANMLLVYTFNRAISKEEYLALDADPYQLLKPISPLCYFPAAAAAAGSGYTGSLSMMGVGF